MINRAHDSLVFVQQAKETAQQGITQLNVSQHKKVMHVLQLIVQIEGCQLFDAVRLSHEELKNIIEILFVSPLGMRAFLTINRGKLRSQNN